MFPIKSSRFWIGIFLLLPLFLFSQNNDRCHSDQKMDALIQADPAYKKAIKNDQPTGSFAFKNSQVVVTIPVHVIITHPPGQGVGTGVNFSVAHIQSQIDVLNEDFRRLNSDAGNTPSVFPAADSEIEFCLASIDPSGNPTDGITRHGTNQNLNSNENAIKSATGWDRNTYLNMWVGDGLGGILGWAYLPSTNGLPNATLDGVVIASCTFGGPGFGSCSPYDLGRTSTHEVGHYLGLRHVWGNGGCNNDDNIADTPIQSSSNFGCPNHPSPSCNNGGDMFMNYMDYVHDDCMNAFTVGQNTRMHDILNSSRSSLLTAAAAVCSAQGVPLVLSITSQTNVSCNGGSDGSITVDATGGTGNYEYIINNGSPQNNNTFTNLSAGTYLVEVDDGNNSISINVTISEPSTLIPLITTQVDIDCFGNTNGVIVASAVGGTNNSGSGYLYDFNGSGYNSNSVFTNLTGGTYTLSVQDENMCISTLPIVINEPAELNSFITNQVAVDCAGNNTGQVTLGSIGGTPNYLYSTDGGLNYSTNNTITNLGAGNYSVQTIDLNGCTHQFSFDITEPSELNLSVVQQVDLECFGDGNGLIEVSAQGGTTSYQYAIDNGNYQNDPVFSSLSGGTYNVDVQDANGCVQTTSIEIMEPDELLASIGSQTNVSCFGGNTGVVTIDISGGTGTPSILLNGTTLTGNSATFENLAAGNYTYAITDENNCQFISSVLISENNEVELIVPNTQNVSCNGQNNGLIQVQASGGSGNFTYFLNTVNQGNNNVFTNLSGGIYLVETIDDLGCTDLVTVTIDEPPVLEASISQQSNLNCFGENNGSVSVLETGGNGNLQYTLGAETNSTGVFNNLSAGFYTVAVLDINNCVKTVSFEITQPSELTAEETNNVAVDCFGNNSGSLQVTANGGVSNYQFSNGTETNSSGFFNNLSAGNYTISVTDGNNCQTTIQSTVTQPAELNANISNQQNVNCFGENSGSVNLQANGGNGNITFTLNGNTNSTGDFSNLSGGTYAIVVADQNNCQRTIQVIIDEPSELNLEIQNVTNASCAGQEGNVQLNANGGTGNYQYTLGTITNLTGYFEGLSGGIYSAQVSDNNMCTEIVSVEIIEPSTLNASISQSQNINCFGGNEGNVQVAALGGFGNLTFTLGNETNSTGFFQNLTAGNYNVVVEDANNCTSTVVVEITQPAELIANISNQQNVNCFGENSGSVNLHANGGNGNISFTLNGNTNSTGDFPNLLGGTYSIVVEDQNNCQTTVQVNIDEPTELNLEIQNVTNATCAGQEGNVQLSANGGTGNYQFTLGSTTNSTGYFDGLSGGVYSVQVADNNMCTEVVSVEIIEPTTLSASVSQSQNINCFGGNEGSVQVEALGGFGDLTFTLGNETNSTGLFQNLTAGNYNVVVEDANNCTSTVAIEITQPTELIANVSTQQNVNCFGENSGVIELQANGGNGNITFTLNGNSNSTGAFPNLTSGTYSILIVDENNCQTTVQVTLDQPTALNLEIESITDASCAGEEGTVQLIANGGTGDYQYTLGTETNSTGYFEGLGGGIYPIEVLDNNGCTANLNVEISQPSSLSASVSQIQNVNCFGENSGSVSVFGNGGVGDLIYTLGSETNSSGSFENLPAGNYEVTIEDANDCASTVQLEITQPAELNIMINQLMPVNCFEGNDGMVNLSSTGGNGTVEFSLNGETNTTGVFENLPGGNYNLIATDENGCTEEVQILITSPDEINAQIESTQNISCAGENNGMVQISASGGAGNFEFTLGSHSNSTGLFEGVAAGNYPIEILDANNCLVELNVEITEPSAIVFESIQSSGANCNGDMNGFFQVQANGGTGNLTYVLGNETNTSGQFANLAAGTYQVLAMDENNCSLTTTVEIDEPDPIQATFEDIADNQCFGESTGMIDLGSTGGVGTVEFTLNNETNTTGLFENLPAGFYQIQLMDANNCETNINITINQPAPVVPNSEIVTAVNCFGSSDGVVQVTAEGGVGNYTFQQNNNSNTTGLFENLSAGNYEFTVIDGNGCQEFINITLDEPEELQVEILNTTPTGCNGNETGTVQVLATNGVGGYTYEMNGENNSTGIFENLASGVYDLIAIDANGCMMSMVVPISEENDIELESSSSNNVNCFGDETGEIHIEAGSNSGALSYELNGMTNSTGDFENLPAGLYNVTIIDANGCSMIVPFEITEPAELNLAVVGLTNVNCFGMSTGTVNLSATGGNNTFTYSINGESNETGSFENLPAGIYNAEVMDGNGCMNNLTITVSEPDELLISAIDIEPDFGNGEGSATLVGEGGVAPFTYSLDGVNFQDENIFDNLNAGNYDGYVQDANGCVSQITFTIDMQTGITNPELGVNSLDVSPNPFSEFLYLNIDLEFSQNIQLEMWSISGKEVYQKTIHLQNGNHQINLETNQNLPAGSYILRVQNEKGSIAYFKLIKQR